MLIVCLLFTKTYQKYMAMLDSEYLVKPYSIGYPKVSLGDNVGKILFVNGSYGCTMRFDSYIKEVIKTVNNRLKEYVLKFNKKLSNVNYSPKNPFPSVDYRS